jgi:hypothetical protein
LDLGSIVLPSDASILKDGNSTIPVSIDPTSEAEISFATTNLADPLFALPIFTPKKGPSQLTPDGPRVEMRLRVVLLVAL